MMRRFPRLFCLWLAIRFGAECIRFQPRHFLRSFRMMPKFLRCPRDTALESVSTSVLRHLQQAPMGDLDLARFQEDPGPYALFCAHKATLSLWFAPMFRLEVVGEIYPRLERFWSYRYGSGSTS